MYNTSYFLYEYKAANLLRGTKYLQNKKTFKCEQYYYNQDKDSNGGTSKINTWNIPIVDGTGFVVQRFSEFLARYYSKSSKSLSRKLDQATNNGNQASAAAQKPFFVALWFHGPHAPYVGSQKFREIATKEVEKEIAKNGKILCGAVFEKYNSLQLSRGVCQDKFPVHYCKEICRKVKAEYYSAILALDEGIGNVLKLLEHYGQRENTFIVFSSDNGPARFDASGTGVRYVAPGSTVSYLSLIFLYY